MLSAALVVSAISVVAATLSSDGFPDRLALRAKVLDEPTVLQAEDRADGAARRVNEPRDRAALTPIPPGDPDQPFAPLPATDEARIIRSVTGIALPVLETRPSGWLVSTACQAVTVIEDGTPLGRAHVVIDPGHGGVEPGAVGPGGTAEKDLNLTVAREAARLLREAGATVILTRDGDHTMTAAARGLVARAAGPALFVSVHHNGGAPPGDGGPGTIVFTRGGSAESTRFGGLFHQTLTPLLEGAAAEARERHRVWADAMAEHEAAVAATPEGETPPPPPEGEPVLPFRWAGSGNAGVRSWVRADGQDHLAALRHAGPGPAALVEFLYVTNPSEEALLTSEGFLAAEAEVLADAITRFLSGDEGGTGFVADQEGDQPIGGSGRVDGCVEPPLR